MNIFYLDHDPRKAARMHCDQHVHKMLLETAQMLSTAHRENGSYLAPWGLYRSTHTNHPSNKWVRHSAETYDWTHQLFEALSDEYRTRYGKPHATELKLLTTLVVRPHFDSKGWCEPPQCMPEEFKCADTVEAYRTFYINDKARFARWSRGVPAPQWFAAATAAA